MQKRNKIDEALDQLLRETPEGMCLTQQDIATRCGCAWTNIAVIERRAIKKLRHRPVLKELLKSLI